MKRYQVFNFQWQPVLAQPFSTLDEAKRHILALLERYPGPFYVTELTVVYIQEK